MKKFIILLLLAGIGVAGVWYYRNHEREGPAFRTAKVRRGDLTATISATGTIEPLEVIDIGSYVSGKIERLGGDMHRKKKDGTYETIDYGSRVDKGTVLARIDDRLYVPEVEGAQADLEVAIADVKRCEADLEQLKAKAKQAEADLNRGRLAQGRSSTAVSRAELDQLKYTFEAAQAAVPSGQATIKKAKATVEKAKATLMKAKQNLDYCTITSPVEGVIVDRRVNVGQTVVASFNAPSLFLIAKDLNHMVIWASVNEADVGNSRPGQHVRFTVAAFPNDTFTGHVSNIRLNATMTSNVVTYTVVVAIDNTGGSLMPRLQDSALKSALTRGDDAKRGKLLPYLTANLQFEINKHKNVLLVPSPALRWRPQLVQVDPEFREEWAEALNPKRTAGGDKALVTPGAAPGQVALWVKSGKFVRPVLVRTGLTDGKETEVAGDDLKEGDEIILGQEAETRGGGGFGFGSPMKR